MKLYCIFPYLMQIYMDIKISSSVILKENCFKRNKYLFFNIGYLVYYICIFLCNCKLNLILFFFSNNFLANINSIKKISESDFLS